MGEDRPRKPVVDCTDKRIAHIGVVVKDVVKTAKQFAKIFGVGPWVFFDTIPTHTHLHGEPIKDGESCVRLGMAQVGALEIELLQPVYGPSAHMEFFKESETHTICPWKVEASYYNIEVDGQTNNDAAWYYPEVSELARAIKGYVAFWKGVKVEE